jgi:orotate phosphoribosyltransferase
MDLIPTQQQVLAILRKTGALREGHFILPSGRHTDHTVQMPLAMRYYQEAKLLSVGLSRKLRSDPEIARYMPDISIVSPATGGIPVAYGLGEALRARQVYWAEKSEKSNGRLDFRQFMETHEQEQCIVADDILRTGKVLSELRDLLRARGANVLALAVVVHQPSEETTDFGTLPVYSLARLQFSYWNSEKECPLCRQGIPALDVLQ